MSKNYKPTEVFQPKSVNHSNFVRQGTYNRTHELPQHYKKPQLIEII